MLPLPGPGLAGVAGQILVQAGDVGDQPLSQEGIGLDGQLFRRIFAGESSLQLLQPLLEGGMLGSMHLPVRVAVQLLQLFLGPEMQLDVVVEEVEGTNDDLAPLARPDGVFQLSHAGEEFAVLGVDLRDPYRETVVPVNGNGFLLGLQNSAATLNMLILTLSLASGKHFND